MYHNSGDLSDRPGYDLNQVRSICKVQLATLLHAAGFDLPKGVHLEDLEEVWLKYFYWVCVEQC
ncbi:hypothetical protein EDC04DRAFT_2784408 [Pisolithus marmoratus]|nr:hypothetical protein EDC04DRAFT_2784408 [Pisolithus marmoratus]